MTTIVDLGKLRFYWAGDYNPVSEYELNDVVRYGGNVYVYISVVKTIGNEPTDPTYWALMVEGINFIGEWNSATQYYIGDAVAYGSTVYVSLQDNINQQPDTHPSIWSQFVEGIQYEGVYNSSTTYQANDVVTYGPSAYIAKVTTSNNNPTNTTYWNSFVQGISPEGVYNNSTAYTPGQIVAYGANLYSCTANTTGNIPTNTSYWELFIDTIRTRGDWTTATVYYLNDIVVYGGNTYICLVQATSSVFATDLAAGKWEVFNGGVRWRGDWAAATPYLANDIAFSGISTYIANSDFTSSGTFSADYALGRWSFFARGAADILPTYDVTNAGQSLTVDNLGDIAWINASGSTDVFYVSPDGNDSNPGTSLALPFASIKRAVIEASAGNATIFVKTGTYSELALPIVVPPNTAIVGDNQRTVNVQPGAGFAADGVTPNNQATMWQMSNGSILNKMTFKGMTGWVPGSSPDDITTSTIKGVVVGFNPASPVTTKSPYILECAAICSGAVGAYVDGSAHSTGFKSMLFHGYTIISDLGVGYYVRNQGKAEIVSCFTYYCYFGYATTGGGFIRALNGNNSYGHWGVSSSGFDSTEVPVTGNLYGIQLQTTSDPINTGFAIGDTVTGQSSGATALVTNLQGNAGKVYVKYTTGSPVFTAGETIDDGNGNELVIATGGVTGQQGMLLVINNLTELPQPGASISIAGDTYSYVIQAVSGTYVNTSSIMFVALAQEKPNPSADGTAVTIRYKYSQIRLTGHDFLDIGTGGITTTNYPNTPLVPPAQGNEVDETFPGRVYYVSTDQNGNFRVGEYFTVDQGTGTATLNANAFNLSGLTSLRLGSIGAQLGETINEFSSDVTMGGESPTNLAVPTEYAVSGYVQGRVPQAIPTSVGQTGKVLTSAGTTVDWVALSLSEIVGANTLIGQTGTAVTSQYSVFSNSLIAPYAWSLTGTVPSGVSINSTTGLLTASTAVSTGVYSFNIVATGTAGSGTITEVISLTIDPAYPLFGSTTLPSAVAPSASVSSTATQATALSGTVVHTVTAGAIPSWMTLASGGTLSGTAPASPAGTFLGPYAFTVTATNGSFTSSRSFSWSPYLGAIQGQTEYTSSGTYSWVAPTAVTSVSVVCVGGGGAGQDTWSNPSGGGAGLGWKNNITVVPGQAYVVQVGVGGTSTTAAAAQLLGGNSYFIDTSTVAGYGGGNASYGTTGGPNSNTYGGGYVGDGGGAGGNASNYQGGGGAGGYIGRGGNNYSGYAPSPTNSGGGGGGGYYSSTYGTGAGGGVGLQGRGITGNGSSYMYSPFTGYSNSYTEGLGGAGGSGGSNGFYGENPFSGTAQSSSNIQGGSYGGGGGGPGSSWPSAAGNGGGGAVRIIWGAGRAFPETNTADVSPAGPA